VLHYTAAPVTNLEISITNYLSLTEELGCIQDYSRDCDVLSLPICPGLSVPFRLSVPHFSLSVPCKKHYCPTLKLSVPCANISVPRSKFLFEDEGEGEGEGVEVEREVVVVADKYKMVLPYEPIRWTR